MASKVTLKPENLALAIRYMPVFSIVTFGARFMLEHTLDCHPDDPKEALDRARRISSVERSDYLDAIDRVESVALALDFV